MKKILTNKCLLFKPANTINNQQFHLRKLKNKDKCYFFLYLAMILLRFFMIIPKLLIYVVHI